MARRAQVVQQSHNAAVFRRGGLFFLTAKSGVVKEATIKYTQPINQHNHHIAQY